MSEIITHRIHQLKAKPIAQLISNEIKECNK